MKNDQALPGLASCLFMVAPLMVCRLRCRCSARRSPVQVGHLGFSELVGRFNTFSGTFGMDDANPAGPRHEPFEIDAASVDSSHEARDKHLRSPGTSWT